MGVEIVRSSLPGCSVPFSFDLYRDRRFIIGDASEDLTRQYVDALEANNWTYLDCERIGYEPIAWIRHVQRNGWAGQAWRLYPKTAGRIFFEGIVPALKLRFSYLLLCPRLVNAVRSAVRNPDRKGVVSANAEVPGRPQANRPVAAPATARAVKASQMSLFS